MKRDPYQLRKEDGVTLVVALVMLVLITLLVVTGLNMNQGSMQTVGNMQQRNEAYAAAQETVEQVISSTKFFETPANAIASPCNGTANTNCIDLNGDGTPDVTVALNPPPGCVAVKGIKNMTLDFSNTEDLGCAVGDGGNYGTVGAVSGNSMCSDTTWEIHAVATDAVTQAKVEVTQGVGVRIGNDAVTASCP